MVIDKIAMSAFESTSLALALRDAQLQSFVIAGIALEVGIEPTARHGADLTSFQLSRPMPAVRSMANRE